MREICKKYSEELKRYIVEQLESGEMSRADLAVEYGVSKSLLKTWLENYGKFRPQKNIVEVVMKSEKERISELEKALAEAHLKIRAYDELIKIADKKYKLDLKKNIGNMSLEPCVEKDSKSKPPAKSSK
jgi:transposase-like protein